MRFPYRGAGIGFVNSNGILLGKRSKKPFINRWAVPGGGYEKNKDSNYRECAIRELEEETSICIENVDSIYIGEWKLVVPFFSWHTYFYQTDQEFKNLKLDELYELKWIPFNEINKLKLRPFMKNEIKKARTLIKKAD